MPEELSKTAYPKGRYLMGDTHYGDEAESWFYSYEGWASKKREELTQQDQKHLEGGEILESQQPDEISSSYTNQSFLTGEADLLEIEQVGHHITVKIYKGGMTGQPTRLSLNPKEARTLIMMLATAIEGGPYVPTDKTERE